MRTARVVRVDGRHDPVRGWSCEPAGEAGYRVDSFVSDGDRVRPLTREVVSDVWRQAELLLAAPMKNLQINGVGRLPR